MAIVGYEWLLIFIGGPLIIYILWRLTRRRPEQFPQTAPPPQAPTTIIKEREVIKEVVMVPCRYCGGLMPQASVFCSNCGARRQ